MPRMIKLAVVTVGWAIVGTLSAQELPLGPENWDGDPIVVYSMELSPDERKLTLAGDGMVSHRSPRAREVVFSGKITPLECSTSKSEWAVTGLAVADDAENFWHLALVMPPSDFKLKPFIELEEKRAGVWNSVGADHLRVVRSKRTGIWQKGKTYALTLRLNEREVSGEVRDEAGKVMFDVAYALAGKSAVTTGRPAIRAGKGFRTVFSSLNCGWAEELPPAPMARESVPSVPYAGESCVLGVKGRATGFFRVEQDAEGRWWTIDPLGRGVVLTAVDHVTWQGHYCQKTNERKYLEANQLRYGSKDRWEEATLARLKEWGFNAFGAGGDRQLRRRGLIHMEFLSFGGMMSYKPGRFSIRYNEHHVPCGGFPNVFDPSWPEVCRYYAERRCAPNRDDPWLFGYFIDNELSWWGDSWNELKTGLYNTVAKLSTTHSARQALEALNARRGVKSANDAPDEVKAEFLRMAAERYFATASAAIRAADPNHLVLGARFAGFGGADEIVWEVAGRYCDVVTVNIYPWANLDRNQVFLYKHDFKRTLFGELERYAALAKRPVLITEWSFPALDSGLKCLHGAGQRFRTQAERTQATMLTAKTFLSVPAVIGYSYFMWVDEPYWGIRPEFPEDSNYGLVSEKDEPYPVAAAFAALHRESGKWHCSPPPPVREDMPEGDWETAATALAEANYRGPKGVSFTRSGEEYRLANEVGFVLEGRLGGDKVFDRVTLRGREIGNVTEMLSFRVNGRQHWENVARVTDVQWDAEGGRLMVRAVRERGVRPFALTHVFTLFPDQAMVLDEFTRLENLGAESIEVEAFFFRPGAAFAVKPRKEREIVPNLWKAMNGDSWEEKEGGRRWGCSTRAANARPTIFYIDEHGSAHPDAWIQPKAELALPPGRDFRPAPGTMWVRMEAE